LPTSTGPTPTSRHDHADHRGRGAADLRAERADALVAIAGHAAAGALTVDHEVVPFGSVSEAWSRQAAGATSGRIVLAFQRLGWGG
jgi:hypothetical protein